MKKGADLSGGSAPFSLFCPNAFQFLFISLEVRVKYILRKTLILILTVFLISVFTFIAFHIIPGDPASLILGTTATEEQLEALREELGTNRPLSEQYGSWISGFVRGDFGSSIRYRMPVSELIKGRLPVTLALGLIALTMILLLGIPLGILAARKRGTWVEKVIHFLTILGISVPNFFLCIVLMWIFGMVLHLFTPGQYISYTKNAAGFLKSLVWPALSIAIPQTAILTKYIRTAMLEELEEDYVRTARGKGAGETWILYLHVLRNAIVAVVPLIGMIVASVLSGSIIIEQVYGIPGMGKLLIGAVTSRDFPLTQTLVIYITILIVLTNFLVDIAIQLIDPRIRLSEKS